MTQPIPASADPGAATQAASTPRVVVDGKFFRRGGKKFHVKGVTYGPFAPDEHGETFGSAQQAAKDLKRIVELGANTLRVYYVPPRWFLDLVAEHGLCVFVDIPWPKHLCFLDRKELQDEARRAVREAVASCAGHPAVFAFSVVNEVPSEVARWSGPKRVERFIEELVDMARAIDPGCLFTFASYPPTEFLRPQNIDFVCFNVYLHARPSFEAYLARLQTLVADRPLMLGELGMDSWREGEAAKAEFLSWQIESAFRGGLAGTVVFSFTDDWFRGGHPIEDWSFGLTTREREPKGAFYAVQAAYRTAPHFPLSRVPRVSVVVASFNGARTLKICLESLTALNYPNYEIILVDDGSTDNTAEIAAKFPHVRTLRQPNLGLSAARNTGIAQSTGEIVAFTDSDCRADEDWLYYLVGELLRSDFAGIGGHNFLPPEDSATAGAVMASPGGPAHVMLSDREAEHIPGCNMAFYKNALEHVGGFDPVFRKAGDDVDICWRLQNEGMRLGFAPGGFVWHYRRSTVKAYLKQQAGYGEAEALLARKHPEFFNAMGDSIWRGRIYGSSSFGLVMRRPVIYHGMFGRGAFQGLYASQPVTALLLLTSLPWHLAVTLPLVLLSLHLSILVPLAVAAVGVTLGVCLLSAAQAHLSPAHRRWWSRPLVGVLCFLQPIVRGWARYRSPMTRFGPHRPTQVDERAVLPALGSHEPVAFWAGRRGFERYDFLDDLLVALKERGLEARMSTEWSRHDLEVANGPWARLWLSTVTEELSEGRKVLRSRLRTAWTLRAVLALGLVLGVVLLATGLVARQSQWIWMSPLVLPLLYFFFENDARRLRRLVMATLLEKSEERGLVLIGAKDVGDSNVAPAGLKEEQAR
jgi:glycosyltransferase involved in cell wall biosynthesis